MREDCIVAPYYQERSTNGPCHYMHIAFFFFSSCVYVAVVDAAVILIGRLMHRIKSWR